LNSRTAASQFYTGLVADLYEPLLAAPARADDYVPFLERSGPPALELACGSGLPLVDLVERGFDVDGLDASEEMLERCRARAAARGVPVALHRAEMQSFSLPRRYRSIFLAGASFTLLTTDEDAARALACIHEHLLPGGSVLIPLEREDPEAARRDVSRHREVTTATGERLRVGAIGLDVSADGRTLHRRLRYERTSTGGVPEIVERTWSRRSWSQEQFRALLDGAAFGTVAFVAPGGGRAEPDARVFVALARRDPSGA